ncbi:hypothetical protein ACFLZL_04720 [Thermodesulfobacteriota bacterium]
MVTPLVPYIGYDRAAALAKKAYQEGKTVREVVLAEKLFDADELNKILTI